MAVAGDQTGEGHARAHALYDRYYLNVYRYALAQLRSAPDAEDAAQNTFLRAFAAMQKGVAPDNEAAWLFKIAHNVCASSKLAWLRRRRVETPRDLELLASEPAAPEPPREELDGLGDALANMPPRLREAFLLREWQGLSYAEIAARLDTSRSAVETLIFRARRHLAAELQRVQTLWLGPIANWLRGYVAGNGSGVVRGAGVLVVAAGITAAAAVPTHEDRPARTGPQPVRAGGAPEGALVGVTPRDAHGGAAAAPRRHAAPRSRPLDVPLADAAGPGPAGINTVGAETTAPATTATATTATPAPPPPAAPAREGGATTGQTATAAATTTVAAATTTAVAAVPPPPSLPAATLPTVTVPPVTTPVATTPSLTTPTVTVPPTLP